MPSLPPRPGRQHWDRRGCGLPRAAVPHQPAACGEGGRGSTTRKRQPHGRTGEGHTEGSRGPLCHHHQTYMGTGTLAHWAPHMLGAGATGKWAGCTAGLSASQAPPRCHPGHPGTRARPSSLLPWRPCSPPARTSHRVLCPHQLDPRWEQAVPPEHQDGLEGRPPPLCTTGPHCPCPWPGHGPRLQACIPRGEGHAHISILVNKPPEKAACPRPPCMGLRPRVTSGLGCPCGHGWDGKTGPRRHTQSTAPQPEAVAPAWHLPVPVCIWLLLLHCPGQRATIRSPMQGPRQEVWPCPHQTIAQVPQDVRGPPVGSLSRSDAGLARWGASCAEWGRGMPLSTGPDAAHRDPVHPGLGKARDPQAQSKALSPSPPGTMRAGPSRLPPARRGLWTSNASRALMCGSSGGSDSCKHARGGAANHFQAFPAGTVDPGDIPAHQGAVPSRTLSESPPPPCTRPR